MERRNLNCYIRKPTVFHTPVTICDYDNQGTALVVNSTELYPMRDIMRNQHIVTMRLHDIPQLLQGNLSCLKHESLKKMGDKMEKRPSHRYLSYCSPAGGNGIQILSLREKKLSLQAVKSSQLLSTSGYRKFAIISAISFDVMAHVFDEPLHQLVMGRYP